MVTVYVTRFALESDPLEVIAAAQGQAVAEREATRIGLTCEYSHEDEFIELHVTGGADEKMQAFLTALKGWKLTGRTVDVDTAEEETALGETAEGFDVCVIPQ